MTAQEGLIAAMSRAAPGYAARTSSFFAEIARRLVALSAPREGARVLDVATGPGVVLAELVETHDGELVGIDLSADMLAEARRRLGFRVELLIMNAERLEFEDGSFGHVYCSCGLYQLPDPDRAVAEVRRVLESGGSFAVSVFGAPDERWSTKDELYASLQPIARVGRSFDVESLCDLLASFAALDVVEERLDVTYADADDWLAEAWTHGERRILDTMDAAALDVFRATLPAAIEPAREPDGLVHWRPAVVYAVARAA